MPPRGDGGEVASCAALAAHDAAPKAARGGEGKTFAAGTFVWLAGSLCSVHGVPFDAALLLKRYPPPYDIDVLCQALSELGLAVRHGNAIDQAELPAIAFLAAPASPTALNTNGPAANAAEPTHSQEPVLVVRAEGARATSAILVQRLALKGIGQA